MNKITSQTNIFVLSRPIYDLIYSAISNLRYVQRWGHEFLYMLKYDLLKEINFNSYNLIWRNKMCLSRLNTRNTLFGVAKYPLTIIFIATQPKAVINQQTWGLDIVTKTNQAHFNQFIKSSANWLKNRQPEKLRRDWTKFDNHSKFKIV